MCEIIKEAKPPDILAKENKSISEIPITISGLSKGKFVTFLIALFIALFFIEKTPIAAPAPRMVARMEATAATINVFFNESKINSLEKSSLYHFRENPVQEYPFVELKEKAIKTKIGK